MLLLLLLLLGRGCDGGAGAAPLAEGGRGGGGEGRRWGRTGLGIALLGREVHEKGQQLPEVAEQPTPKGLGTRKKVRYLSSDD